MKRKDYVIQGYTLTNDSEFDMEMYGISSDFNRMLGKLYYEVKERSNPALIRRLDSLIEKYPDLPILKNYLAAAYENLGNQEKVDEVIAQTLLLHPDYLFGRIARVKQCIANGNLESVPELLGPTLELRDLYPDRKVFHVSEAMSFLRTVVRYHAKMNDLEAAEKAFALLKEIAPGHPETEAAETSLFMLRLQNAGRRMQAEQEKKITPAISYAGRDSVEQSAPAFHHAEIQWLYEYSIRIQHEKLQTILSLPRETLISDLEAVLEDGNRRYKLFEDNYEEDKSSFVFHALYLLGELQASESLPKVLSFLRLPKNAIDIWIGDHITETFWLVLYKLARNNTAALKAFLCEEGIYTYSKVVVSETLAQLYLHHPEKKEEILAIYTEVFGLFLNTEPEENIIDTDLIALMITDAEDCNFKVLLPTIKALYERGYVSEGICGTYAKLESTFAKSKYSKKRKLPSIFEMYDIFISNWYERDEPKKVESSDRDFFSLPAEPKQAVSTKIGRNEPCPCGSGKKYKKCCG